MLQKLFFAFIALCALAFLPTPSSAAAIGAGLGSSFILPESSQLQDVQFGPRCRRICRPPVCYPGPYGRRICRPGGCRLVCGPAYPRPYPPRPYPGPGPYRY